MAGKLVGQNYTTPDLVAKVTGKAKYAEDYRAEGMLFAKLLLSPMPHARVTRHRHERGAGDAGRQGDPHRRRPAAGRRRRQPRRGHHRQHAQRARADERAALRGRADSRRRGRRRADRRRSDREDPDRVRAAAVRRRSGREPAARIAERARPKATCGCGRSPPPRGAPARRAAGAGTEVDRRGFRRRRARASCRSASTPTSGWSATSTPGSSRRT